MFDFSYLSHYQSLNDDERFMLEALREAKKAFEAEEVPVGAVIVYQGEVVAKGHNQVELLQDATAHAEVLAIGSASSYLQNWRLKGAVLYTTLEPCPMCAGAMLLSRVERLVYGARDIRHGACGSFIDLFEKKHPTHSMEIEGGVLESLSSEMLKQFFKLRRETV